MTRWKARQYRDREEQVYQKKMKMRLDEDTDQFNDYQSQIERTKGLLASSQLSADIARQRRRSQLSQSQLTLQPKGTRKEHPYDDAEDTVFMTRVPANNTIHTPAIASTFEEHAGKSTYDQSNNFARQAYLMEQNANI